MAPHSRTLAWRIPWTGEPGGLPSMGSQSRTRLKRLSSSSSRKLWYRAGNSSVLWWPGGREGCRPGGRLGRKGYMCTDDWFMLLYSRNQHSLVKQLYAEQKSKEKTYLVLGIYSGKNLCIYEISPWLCCVQIVRTEIWDHNSDPWLRVCEPLAGKKKGFQKRKPFCKGNSSSDRF